MELLQSLITYLAQDGQQAVVVEGQQAPAIAKTVSETQFGTASDLVVVLGGDGTMLRAASIVADHGVPVLGINLGRLGFLTPFAPEKSQSSLTAALNGKLPVGERMRLEVIFCPRRGSPIVRSAVNDAVVHQGAMARLIELEASMDGEKIASYRADGLIVATPTGSTAYNLAAGGPILTPGQETMTLTPICAHALTNRPLVVPKSATLSLRLGSESRGAVLTVDGQWAQEMHPGDCVEIRAAQHPLILFMSHKGYFTILREKLHWGAGLERRPA